jgi:outer membrane protein assembly factor BamB
MRTGGFGLRTLLLLGCTLALAGPAAAGNWPRFRGPNGAGIAPDKNVPIEWNDNEGILWKTALPGEGHSCPVVWGDRIFLQSATKDARQRLLLCLDTGDGKVLWSRSVPGAAADHIYKGKNTLASSTPAVDGERVYAVFWDGRDIALQVYDFKGNLVWQRALGNFTSQHGVGASPIVCGDKVILNNDQDGSAVLLAFDAKTGKPAWQAKRPAYRACYSEPFLLERPGQPTELIVSTTMGITGYNPDTGTEDWNWEWKFTAKMPLRTVASPILGQGLILANSGDGGGDRHMVAVKPGGKGEDGPKLAWENKRDFPYVPCMLAWGEHIYFVTDKGFAGCYVTKTGERVWSERLGSDMTASPVLINGKVVACGEDGEVYVFAAAPEFKLLAKNSLGEVVKATPAVADDRLYIRGAEHLFCIGKK